jgi:pimeloyl-ACP methyl ester carboxylesterase
MTVPTPPSHSLSYKGLGHSPLLRAPRTSDPAPADGAAFAAPAAVISPSETPIASTSKLSSPSLGLLVTEPLRGALEYGRMHLMRRDHLPTGDGHAVVLFPGLGTDRRFMSPLKDHCQQLGYACYDWTRGFNFGPEGDVEYWLTELAAEVRNLIRGHQQSVSLIGWSLGGIYAREIAKVLTKRIRQVITLGSPFAGIDATRATWLYRLVNGSGVPARKAFAQALKSPPPVPTSSIYSRSDGVVAWKSCREVSGPRAENIEVVSSHLGLVCHPTVFTVIADRLAQRPGQWSPWRDRANLEAHVSAA